MSNLEHKEVRIDYEREWNLRPLVRRKTLAESGKKKMLELAIGNEQRAFKVTLGS